MSFARTVPNDWKTQKVRRPSRAPLHKLPLEHRCRRIFKERLEPLGCEIEFEPGGSGTFIEIPSIRLTDYGATCGQAIINIVESALQVAAMRKAPGERWTKDLEEQHRVLKKALGRLKPRGELVRCDRCADDGKWRKA